MTTNDVVAAFDFDVTLTIRDTVVPFLDRVAGRARLISGLLGQPLRITDALARRDRDRIKAVAIRAVLAGRSRDTVESIGAEFAGTIRDRWMRADTGKRLEWHQRMGHRVVLVSASLGPYLRPIGSMLGVDGVLCCEAAVAADGRYSGALIDGNCRGPEKVRRLRLWLAERGSTNAELWAYGDSAGDRELLSAARHHHFVKDREIAPEPDFGVAP